MPSGRVPSAKTWCGALRVKKNKQTEPNVKEMNVSEDSKKKYQNIK